MVDTAIREAIREYLTRIQVKGISETNGKFRLEFDYNGKHYITHFIAVHNDKKIAVQNGCIHMDFEYLDEKGTPQNKFIGSIDSDSPKRKCFEPVLETNLRNKPSPRTTAADVLQILKTKLALAFPVDARVNLNDGAQKDRIMIAPFNILRGGNAFYEKYGYRSKPITELKTKIQTFQWSACNEEIKKVIQDYTEKIKKIIQDATEEKKKVIKDCTGQSDWAPDMRLMDIMNTISWDCEKAYNNVKGPIDEEDFINPSLSYRVFRHFATIAGGIPFEQTDQFREGTIWEFWLEPESAEWRRCNEELVFTKFEPVLAGGRRKTHVNKRPRNKSRKSSNRQSYRRSRRNRH